MPVSVQVYKFDELGDSAKERARSWCRESLDYDVNETITEAAEYWHSITDDVECLYSLNHCQGDRVAFQGSPDMDKICEPAPPNSPTKKIREQIARIYKQLVDMDYYVSVCVSGERRMQVDVDLGDGPDFANRVDDIVEFFEDRDSDPMMTAGILAAEAEDWNAVLVCCDWLEERGIDCQKIRVLVSGPEFRDELEEQLRDNLQEFFKVANKHLQKIGYEEIEYQDSNEVIDDNIRANEYLFSIDGRFYVG
jgi:hypothetical protein